MKVLVAVDGSDCSTRMIEFLSVRPWNKIDQFLVICVAEEIPQEFRFGYFPPAYDGLDERILERCIQVCDTSGAKIRSKLPDNSVETKVPFGKVADAICQCAEQWNADLIVMGSHGRKGVSHFLLGSVAEQVLKDSPCSVEIVKAHKKVLEGSTSKARQELTRQAKSNAV